MRAYHQLDCRVWSGTPTSPRTIMHWSTESSVCLPTYLVDSSSPSDISCMWPTRKQQSRSLTTTRYLVPDSSKHDHCQGPTIYLHCMFPHSCIVIVANSLAQCRHPLGHRFLVDSRLHFFGPPDCSAIHPRYRGRPLLSRCSLLPVVLVCVQIFSKLATETA